MMIPVYVFGTPGLSSMFCYTSPAKTRRRTSNFFLFACLVAWFSLFFPSTSQYLAFIQSCYQGFVLANYFLLLQLCLGGRAGLVRLIGQKPPKKRGRRCWCLWELEDRHFDQPYHIYLSYKRRSMQFVLVMPTLGLITIILTALEVYNSDEFSFDSAFMWISIIHIASVLTAMMSSDAFLSLMAPEIERLASDAKLKAKFWCVKSTVFLSFLQYFIISFIFYLAKPTTTEYSAATVQQCIICIELAIASVAHVYYFSWKEYATPAGGSPTPAESTTRVWRRREFTTFQAIANAMQISDVLADSKAAIFDETPERLPDDVKAPLLPPATPADVEGYGARAVAAASPHLATTGLPPSTTPRSPVATYTTLAEPSAVPAPAPAASEFGGLYDDA